MKPYRSGVAFAHGEQQEYFSQHTASTPVFRAVKKYSQPLMRPRDEEIRLNETVPVEPLETSLLKELEGSLTFSEKSEAGLTTDLKTVRRTLQMYIRENPRSRAFLTRIMTFYEETALRLQREVDFLSKQVAKLGDDKVLLEKALIQVTEKQMQRVSASHLRRRPTEDDETRKLLKTSSVTTFSPTAKAAAPRPVPVPPQPVSVPPARDKGYRRPRSVPRLNLDSILKGRNSESFLVPRKPQGTLLVQDL